MEIVVLKSISNLAEILLVLSKQISNISQPVGPVARVMLLASFRFEDDDEIEDQVQLLLIVRMLKSVTVMA